MSVTVTVTVASRPIPGPDTMQIQLSEPAFGEFSLLQVLQSRLARVDSEGGGRMDSESEDGCRGGPGPGFND